MTCRDGACPSPLAATGPEAFGDGVRQSYSSGGRSKLTRSPRKPFVFQAPNAIPRIIQIPPTIQAFQLRFFQRKKQIVKPASGGAQTARIASNTPATMKAVWFECGHNTNPITNATST